MQRRLISDGIKSQAEKRPQKPAVIGTDGKGADYSDAVRVFDAAEKFIAEINLRSNDRVAILSEDGIGGSLLTLPFAEHAVIVPLDPELGEERLSFFLKLLRVNYILTDKKSGVAYKVAEENGLGILVFQYSGDMGNLQCVFQLLCSPSESMLRAENNADDVCLLKTTSGTTSTPKIVPKTYRMLCRIMLNHIREYGQDDNEVHPVLTKIHQNHSFGNVWLTLYTGGTAIVTNGFHHKEFIDLIKTGGATWIVITPAVLNSITSYLEESKESLSGNSLRFIRSSGAPLTKKTREYFEGIFQVPIVQTYGLSESGNVASTYQLPKGLKEGSVGTPRGVEVKILEGEILVRGDTVFAGYENPEESNDEYFIDGWFRTGDAGYLDEDGYLFITGRFKEMINRGGEKVSPYEVESAIQRHEAVADAAVFPIPNSYGSEDVGAVVVLKEGADLDIDGLRSFLTPYISSYKMPTKLFIAGEVPVGGNHKVQRRRLYETLKELYPEQAEEDLRDVRAAGPAQESGLAQTEQALMDIWKAILKKSRIGIDDDFFRIGGDSLLAALLYSQIELKLGVQIPINILFHKTTIRELAGFIDHREAAASRFKFIVPIKSTGYKNPLFCLHPGDGEATTYHSIGKYMEENRPVYGLRFVQDGADWIHPLTFDQMGEEYAKEIQSMDPYGPYNLCGTCYGGVLAFATASALARAGKEISMLCMLDSTYPKNSQKRRDLRPLLVNNFHELRTYDAGKMLRMGRRKLRTMVRLLVKPFLTKKYLNKTRDAQGIKGDGINYTAALAHAHNYYKPEFFPGAIHYFRTTRDIVKDTTPQTYWKLLAKDFHIIDMPCRHNAINTPENSQFLISQFCGIMEKNNA